jgi:hypothetical protein
MPNDPAWPEIAQKRARKIKILSNYKFYLAFENFNLDDYVSEKVFIIIIIIIFIRIYYLLLLLFEYYF